MDKISRKTYNLLLGSMRNLHEGVKIPWGRWMRGGRVLAGSPTSNGPSSPGVGTLWVKG